MWVLKPVIHVYKGCARLKQLIIAEKAGMLLSSLIIDTSRYCILRQDLF